MRPVGPDLPVRMYCSLIAPYSSWPAVSSTSSSATSSSMMHCLRYESSEGVCQLCSVCRARTETQ